MEELESLPAQIEYDWTKEGSGVEGLKELGSLTLYKRHYFCAAVSNGWCLKYGDIREFDQLTVLECVTLMKEWLSENQSHIKVISQ